MRVAVVDYGCKRSILRRLAANGAAVDVFPHDVDADTLAGYDGVLLSPGPGDPAPLAGEAQTAAGPARAHAGARRLPRPPAARARDRQGDVQAAVRAPRREPSGARPPHDAGCSSRRRTTASRSPPATSPASRTARSTTARSRGSTYPELRARSAQFHPEAVAGPARRGVDHRRLGRRAEGRLMPRRTDIESICLIGSGPIVIGQAAEFDYAGCQALKVLREDGYRTIVVNSNPATIMTDPGFADRTYLEPLDLEGVSGRARAASGPTRCCRRWAAAPRSTSRASSTRPGVLARARHRADRRATSTRSSAPRTASSSSRRSSACGLKVPTSRIVTSPDDLVGVSLPGGRAAGVHARRPRRRLRRRRRAAARAGRARHRGVADRRRCSSRSRCAAGTSSSSRSCATTRTTS